MKSNSKSFLILSMRKKLVRNQKISVESRSYTKKRFVYPTNATILKLNDKVIENYDKTDHDKTMIAEKW